MDVKNHVKVYSFLDELVETLGLISVPADIATKLAYPTKSKTIVIFFHLAS